MSADKQPDQLHGLSCPKCGGRVNLPEGEIIIKCPYCSQRSFVRGERGLLRFQSPLRVDQPQAQRALSAFLSGNLAIAPSARSQSRLVESLLIYLPFWTTWTRLVAWVFGEKKVGSGKDSRYEPREVRLVQQLTWNRAAAEVGEFGVTQIPPIDPELEPFNPELLHQQGMVFEPVGSFSDANRAAQSYFENHTERQAGLDRVSQVFLRTFSQRFALVYHPLWVHRYLFRGRAFQVVVDGVSGKVLYGKAPGNLIYRAALLVLGMAFGAFLAIDVPAFIVSNADDGDVLWFALVLFVGGLVTMFASYRKFRHGEHYEYQLNPLPKLTGGVNPFELISSTKDLEKWIDRLS